MRSRRRLSKKQWTALPAIPYIKDFMRYGADEAYFGALKLPDQLVYLGGKMSGAIRIRAARFSTKQAKKRRNTIEETLLSVAYVIDMMASGPDIAADGRQGC